MPFLALIISFLFPNENEKAIFTTSIVSVVINYFVLIAMAIIWVIGRFETIYLQGPVLYHTGKADFTISFLLDGYSLAYLLTATFLTGIIIIFSKNYIHREKGYKRFFNNIKFFYFGLLVVLMSGNLETLFVGWEILGVTSFFLIGFYRERYLPVKNALKVISVYRIADVALLLGIWLSHHYFGYSINFKDLDGLHSQHHHIINETIYLYLIPGLFLLAAMVKSAQFPFSSWLPRAMEGPTTSSSIFYGSLSAHIGVFLLIRTAPFWEGNYWFHFIIGGIGLITVVLSSFTAKVQSTIKTQIAYSSLAQIGLMFMEISVGLYWVAIIHFIGNAMLRSHQLLISPSILSYKIHDQFFHFNPPTQQKKDSFMDKLKLTLYILSIKEFNLDTFMFNYLWTPLKKMGNWINFLTPKITFSIFIPIYLIGLYAIYNRDIIPENITNYLPEIFALISLVLILKSFIKRKSVLIAWLLIIVSQLFLSLSFGFNEKFDFNQVHLYLSGIILSGVVGLYVIHKLKKENMNINLNQFQGHVYEHPILAFVFMLACLGISGFPITPTFIGEDLMLGHIYENQFVLLTLLILCLALDGLVVFRIYSRLFLGQHKSDYHDFAYRSS
jgi:NADH:ubiquinone oxidoreductase subunit 5 (subunit L)/multisubunit Na+/H+ antiporter MnhA subunit